MQLQRCDRPGLKTRAFRFSIVLWIVLWGIVGILWRLILDEWYGFGAGFLLGGAISTLLMWRLFTGKDARKRYLMHASFDDTTLDVHDPLTGTQIHMDLTQPHRAILIIAPAERRFLLRLEQPLDDASDVGRLDIGGQIPMLMPMQPTGKATSLMGFFSPSLARRESGIICDIVGADDLELVTTNLFTFVEAHKDHRDNGVIINKGTRQLEMRDRTFTLHQDGDIQSFGNYDSLDFYTRAQLRQAVAADKRHRVTTAQVFFALVPHDDVEKAIVFSIIAPRDWTGELPATWPIPDAVTDTHFALYDDSVNSIRATRILKRVIKSVAPDSPILDLLRH